MCVAYCSGARPPFPPLPSTPLPCPSNGLARMAPKAACGPRARAIPVCTILAEGPEALTGAHSMLGFSLSCLAMVAFALPPLVLPKSALPQ